MAGEKGLFRPDLKKAKVVEERLSTGGKKYVIEVEYKDGKIEQLGVPFDSREEAQEQIDKASRDRQGIY